MTLENKTHLEAIYTQAIAIRDDTNKGDLSAFNTLALMVVPLFLMR